MSTLHGPTADCATSDVISCRYRLEIVAEETRVRKVDNAADGDDATPVKRLCMSNVSGTADKEAEMARERKLNQLLATNKVRFG